jgi:integrase
LKQRVAELEKNLASAVQLDAKQENLKAQEIDEVRGCLTAEYIREFSLAHEICPYYLGKELLPHCRVVALTYVLLASSLRQRDHEVIASTFDEPVTSHVRTAEIARLDWHEVRLTEKFIIIEAGKAKTAARRLVPITRQSGPRGWHPMRGPLARYLPRKMIQSQRAGRPL